MNFYQSNMSRKYFSSGSLFWESIFSEKENAQKW